MQRTCCRVQVHRCCYYYYYDKVAQPLQYQYSCCATLSRYILSRCVFQDFKGCRRRMAPPCSALKEGVALQVASWKVSRYRGVSQLRCRLSRSNGPLSSPSSSNSSSSSSSSSSSTTTSVHAIYTYYIPPDISRYRVGELYLMNLPQIFSRHALVVTKNCKLIRCLYTALWQIRPVKLHWRTPSPIPAR